MTYEEALEIVKSSNPLMQFSLNSEKVGEYVNCVISALDRRVAKKPYKRSKAQKDNGLSTYACSKCCNSVYRFINICCPTCGQALDWSD